MWLDSNAFTGLVPDSLSKATALLKLHLEDNNFADSIPALALSSLSSFNVSNNDLKGVIPNSYSKFNARSFLGNKVSVRGGGRRKQRRRRNGGLMMVKEGCIQAAQLDEGGGGGDGEQRARLRV
ncbi:hypothetical protein B296_00018830 [Ensete ventricosum]|uniref:Uncharacterized protein n=1 Tax=Ensete ventricosum TaxID=4639 RepID=A0A426YT54_ENSVE|nr:hypothetical protein B296_00018830 [Ensete ventricosum]